MTDRAALRKLALQIERDALTQQRLRGLLAGIDAVLLDRRRELRHLKTRLASTPRSSMLRAKDES